MDNMKNYLLVLLYIAFSLNGCKENPIEEITPASQKIKKIIESDERFVEYTYEGDFLIKEETKSNDGGIIYSKSFTYDKGRLIRLDQFSSLPREPLVSYSTYDYSADNIILKENVFGRGDKFNYYILYEYENYKIIKYSYFSPTSNLSGYHMLKYEDGNITEDAYYNNKDSLLIIETYEYDNMKNPLKVDLSQISAFTLSKNNITKWSEINYLTTIPNIYITINLYNYNEYNYPIKCFVNYTKNENGIISQDTSTTFYEYN